MNRAVVVVLLLAGCSQSMECELRDPRTGKVALEGELAAFTPDGGGFLASSAAECDDGWCVRDESMPARAANRVALGVCAEACNPLASTCAATMRCTPLFDLSAGVCTRQ